MENPDQLDLLLYRDNQMYYRDNDLPIIAQANNQYTAVHTEIWNRVQLVEFIQFQELAIRCWYTYACNLLHLYLVTAT